MKYELYYIEKETKEEKLFVTEAESDEEATKKLYEEKGYVEFGCIKPNGKFFNDNYFKELSKQYGKKTIKKEIAIVNVNLEYEYPENDMGEDEKEDFLEHVELPKNYVEGSFEFVKDVIEEVE